MSTRLERILERDLARSARAFDNARVTYSMLRNGLVGLGFSAAVFLPLAASDPSKPEQPPTPPQQIQQNFSDNYYYNESESTPGDASSPPAAANVHLDLVTYKIQSAPPMTRDWHEMNFTATGDEFWALPDASFTLTFKRSEPWEDCSQQSCGGSLAFASTRFLKSDGAFPDAFEIDERTVSASPGLNAATKGECKLITQDLLTPTQYCRLFDPEPPDINAANPDLCVWMRRSEHLEIDPEMVAVEIRWERTDGEKPCSPLLPKR